MAKKNDTVNESVPAGVTLTRDDKPRKYSGTWLVYTLPGGGMVYLPTNRIANPPETITLHGVTVTEPVRRPKLTDEEKAALKEARKNETPAQKAARAQETARKAQERADRLAKFVGMSAEEYAAANKQ